MLHCIDVVKVASTTGQRGRARDPGIDARVLAAAHRYLSAVGYEAMSVAAVAHEAGTTRQALYRRWPDKVSLAADALQAAADAGPAAATADPLADLAAELADFARGVSGPGRLSLVGTMLQEGTAAEARARYQARVIAPRRRRILAILERARALGLIDADAEWRSRPPWAPGRGTPAPSPAMPRPPTGPPAPPPSSGAPLAASSPRPPTHPMRTPISPPRQHPERLR
jgi:AcrR family transcriptional regulator